MSKSPGKSWCRRAKDHVRGYYLKPPYNNVFIGCDPCDGMTRKSAESFDAFVNVADSPCNTFHPAYPGQDMRWYPVNEMGLWNLSYLYWLKKVMDFHHDKGHRIYLHCHAGAYRSPSAAVLWLQSRGHSPTAARNLVNERRTGLFRIWKNNGNIPVLKDEVFRLMRKHKTWGLSGIIMEACKHVYWNREIFNGDYRTRSLWRHYFHWYYGPKSWIKNTWENFWRWKNGNGYHKEGCCSWHYKRKNFWDSQLEAEPLNPREAIVTGKYWCPKRRKFIKNKRRWRENFKRKEA